MLPIAPLMIEHRLIERVISLMGREVIRMKNSPPNIDFVTAATDFVKTYADKLHHGKEENILFAALAKKKMSAEHKKIMDELVHEHGIGRDNLRKLVAARQQYLRGEKAAAKAILESMENLVKLYPPHIEKEDKHFFIPVMDYFSEPERMRCSRNLRNLIRNLFM
jgi:hemerythrin-like domain-containing protein